jgi:hypothetical protein
LRSQLLEVRLILGSGRGLAAAFGMLRHQSIENRLERAGLVFAERQLLFQIGDPQFLAITVEFRPGSQRLVFDGLGGDSLAELDLPPLPFQDARPECA